jgi:hypothetical protein
MSRPIDLDALLSTDPRDAGCEHAMAVLHVYAELVAAHADAATHYPEVAAHTRACGPCAEDLDALLETIGSRSELDTPER